MVTTSKSIHSEAGMHRKLVLFAVQLEGYLAHFPNCHKHALTQACAPTPAVAACAGWFPAWGMPGVPVHSNRLSIF